MKFVAEPSEEKFISMHAALHIAYLQWQRCSAFEIGPAADEALRANVNTFPTDVNRINANMQSGGL